MNITTGRVGVKLCASKQQAETYLPIGTWLFLGDPSVVENVSRQKSRLFTVVEVKLRSVAFGLLALIENFIFGWWKNQIQKIFESIFLEKTHCGQGRMPNYQMTFCEKKKNLILRRRSSIFRIVLLTKIYLNCIFSLQIVSSNTLILLINILKVRYLIYSKRHFCLIVH